jgi:hypothetical protein
MIARNHQQRKLGAVTMAVAHTAGPGSTGHAETAKAAALPQKLVNASYRLTASIADGIVRLRFDDLRTGLCVADGPCLYHAVAKDGTDSVTGDRLDPRLRSAILAGVVGRKPDHHGQGPVHHSSPTDHAAAWQ